MATLQSKQYQDEDAAREHLEKIQWPGGPVCPHCGLVGEAYKLTAREDSKTSVRKGVYKCASCREQFTVTVGTIFEDSKIPLHKWLLAIHLMCSSKKGISAHQLWRNLWPVDEETGKQTGSYRTAWFMAHRIRWALGQEPIAEKLKGIFEIDDTWVGGKLRPGPRDPNDSSSVRFKKQRAGFDPKANKTPVVSILQRDGTVRSAARITSEELRPVMDDMIDKANSHIMTDSATRMKLSKYGWKHSAVNHSKDEYVRHEDGLVITTNTVEGYFSILKRGIHGVYHHVGKHYLDQYLREFDFRYNVRKVNDSERVVMAVRKTSGKRLMLREPKGKRA
jgi:transposase-like protein